MTNTIFILDKSLSIIDALSNNGDSPMSPFFDDKYVQELSSGAETYEFSTLSSERTNKYLTTGNYIAFKYNNKVKVFQIIETSEDHEDFLYKTCYCEIAGLELINDVVRSREIASANVRKFMETILEDTEWRVGIVDAAINSVQTVNITKPTNVYSLIQNNLNLYDMEIEYRFELSHNQVIGKYIDVYSKRGKKTKKRFEYGENVSSVSKQVDISELCTAMIGVGTNNIDFKSVEWGVDDPAIKPLNQDFIADEETYKQFNNNGSHIMGVFQAETESPHELLVLTWNELQRRKNPKFTYDISVEMLQGDDKEVNIGDTIYVIDNDYSPALHLTARIGRLELSFTDYTKNKCVLTNFKEIKSGILSLETIQAIIDGRFPITSENIANGAITEGKIDTEYLHTIKTDVIIAAKAEVGELIADKASITDLEAINIKVEDLEAKNITVSGKLEANEAEIKALKVDLAEIDTLLAGNITSENIQSGSITANEIASGTITAGSGVIADGAIGSAQISSLDAAKISSGTIDTSKVTVSGPNSNLKMSGNRLQVFTGVGSGQVERVSLGDVNGDGSKYGLLVRGSDGQTVIMDENGVTNAGITNGSITNEKISGDANIDAAKININSVINRINSDGSESIQGTKIDIEGTNLSTKLSNITTTQTEQGKKISEHSSKITANENAISLKVDSQVYQTDKEGIETQLNKNTSDIALNKEAIALKVEQTDINKAKSELEGKIDSKVESAKSEIKVTTDKISQNISNLTTTVNNKADGSTVSNLSNKVSSIENNLSGVTTRVGSVEAKQTTTDGKVSSLETRVTNAESKITETAITNTVKKSFYTKDETEDAITSKGYQTKSEVEQTANEVQFRFEESGGYNRLVNSAFKNGTTPWTMLSWNNIGDNPNATYRMFVNHQGQGDWLLPNRNILVAEANNLTTNTQKGLGIGFDYAGIWGGTEWTFSCMLACHRAKSITVEIIEVAPDGTRFPDYNGWKIEGTYYGGQSRDNWYHFSENFSLKNEGVANFIIRIFMNEWNGELDSAVLFMAEPMLTLGNKKDLPYTPNSDELYAGITTIDKNGITINMSNGEGNQGNTNINHEGLTIYNSYGEKKAWFGDDDSAYIQKISTDNIFCDKVVKYSIGRPTYFYVSTSSTGDGTGRDINNKSNSLNHVLEYIKTNFGQASNRQDIVISIDDGTYNESVYIGGWMGTGIMYLNFGKSTVWYGNFVIEECTMPIMLQGQKTDFNINDGAILETRNGQPTISVRNSTCRVSAFRARCEGGYYSGTFVKADVGSNVMVYYNDLVGFFSVAQPFFMSTVYVLDNRGDVDVVAGSGSTGTVIMSGHCPLLKNGLLTWNNYATHEVELGYKQQNSIWIPKVDVAPPPPQTNWQWFEQSFNATRLRTQTEGSGSTTSNKTSEWGQGKWGSYKSHRGFAEFGNGPSSWASGGRNFTVWLTMTRINTSHGYAGETPQPKLKEPNGNFWNSGTGFARGSTKTIQLPASIANAIVNGSMQTLEMWAGASKNDYSFYNNVSIKIKCEKQV